MAPTARVRFTTIADGDLAVGGEPAPLAARRQAVCPHPWTWMHQVHGAHVVTVTAAGEHAGAEADAAVTAVPGAALSVQTADCVPVALLAPGAVGVVHAGWRGLLAGVVGGALDALRAVAGPGAVRATLGPCIRARCYEFGPRDLDQAAGLLGDGVRATTAWGAPALDLAAGVALALRAGGVDTIDDPGTCTACSPIHFSHRARGDAGRQAVVAWLEP